MSWSANGQYLAVARAVSPWLSIIRVSDWVEMSGVFAFSAAPAAVEYSGNNDLAVVASNVLRVLSADGATSQWFEAKPTYRANGVAWSPTAPLKTLSGSVENEFGAPAARDILIVHDASEQIIGSTTSSAGGTWSFQTPFDDGHTALLQEADGRVQAIGGGILPL